MKIIRLSSKSASAPFVQGDTIVTEHDITIDGERYPVIDIKAVRKGLSYEVSVAYDETRPSKPATQTVQQAVPATETAQPTADTSVQAEPVKKPRFRLHKVQPQPQPQPQEPVQEPVQQAEEPEAVDEPVQEEKTVDPEVLRAIAELIVKQNEAKKAEAEQETPSKNADSSDVAESTDVAEEPSDIIITELADGGRIEVRYWRA